MGEYLPDSLILDILSRLTDSSDLARCQVASKTLHSVAQDVQYINLICTLCRYQKSRSEEGRNRVTPFKTIFRKLVQNTRRLESISIGVDRSLAGIAFDDLDDEYDDLYMNDIEFVKDWLPRVCEDLRFLSISDFWLQSCWRKSEVLALISSCCHRLLELEVKNAWLSVDGLNPMPRLTSLTLEFVRLEDKDLNKVNECFPCLQVLSLVGVGGLKEPKIHLLHLKTCLWTVSNAPLSLSIFAPNLVELKLKCIKPKFLVLETPLLSDFHLSLEKAGNVRVKEFLNLQNLQLESSSFCSIIDAFPLGNTIKKLKVDLLKSTEPETIRKLDLGALFNVFPNVNSLSLGPRAWSEVETCFRKGGLENRTEMKELKEIMAHLVIDDIDVSLSIIYCILDKCTNLSSLALLIHREVDSITASKFISRCTVDYPQVRWKWGMWKEGTEDTWLSDDI
ncbi:F-box/LRR-repeat protein At4g29420 [Pistacia vera]|uniref:F-box/LRR-repeat protein At4g29420 n=1 Tax=Pistacia vera TaxID=55513 RepID=UPI00126395EC|nr:F-box/LRR-repeat protein At4g29420 [Pistacia vera]